LRHTAATKLRKQFGIEAARVVLGHRSASVTEVYAELDQMKAAEVMGRVGCPLDVQGCLPRYPSPR
jgi:integrase